MRLESLTLRRLELPLKTPYELAFGPVAAFDSILAELRDEDGRTGYGEATVLTGYTAETPEGAWQAVGRTAAKMAGLDLEAATADAAALIPEQPFAATALVTALEMLQGDPHLEVEKATAVPLLAILNAKDRAGLEREIEARLAEGYGALKIKVGFEPAADLARVHLIQNLVGGRARLRIDGNQGYDREAALGFAAALDPVGIELFEQPCAADDWEAAVAVAKVAAVPMMLDESIYGLAEIERAAELAAAAFIKVKLMKLGGLARLAAALARIRDCGLIPVLGNGVAGELGCWMEACIARDGIDNAGEMNGFLKPKQGLFKTPLAVENGALLLAPEPPAFDPKALDAATRETARFPNTGSR